MSVFQVTRTSDKKRMTIVATQVISISEEGNSTLIYTSLGSVIVDETYCSVRGYLKKALAPASSASADAQE